MIQIVDRTIFRYLILLIYLLVNGLFVYKYAPAHSLLLSLCYQIVVGFVYFFYLKIKWTTRFLSKVHLYAKYVTPILILFVIIFIKNKLQATNVVVDRWSALYNWTEYLISGKYPYAAKTHLGQYASPFPFWEVLHIPFYFLGDEIFAHCFMLFILFLFLRKFRVNFDSAIFFILVFLSPSYWWEVVVRSDLMNNLMLSAIFIISIDRYLRVKGASAKFGLIGLCAGLLLCSRLFLIFPFGIYFIATIIRAEKKNQLSFLLNLVIGFFVPIIPFLIWNLNMFLRFEYSPLHLQTQFGTPLVAIVGLLFLVICSFLWKTMLGYLGLLSVVLFSFISLRILQNVWEQGWESTIFRDGFDISYLNICLPFSILFLAYTFSKNNVSYRN